MLAVLAAAAAMVAVLALRSSGTEATPPPQEPAVRAFVSKIENILTESAAARRSIGNTLVARLQLRDPAGRGA